MIAIPNMEKPKNCYQCSFNDGIFCALIDSDTDAFIKDNPTEVATKVLPDCPIIEIDQEDEEWQTGKPKERGKYLVTVEYWVGDKELYVDVAYYGIMYGEKHECFYQTDSEWGDCKLDGVLAWMPLPEPWKGE